MSLSPAILDAMVSAGCTAEQIAAAVKADMAEQEQRADAKRVKDRERKRRQRSRDVTDSHAMSHDVTRTGCDNQDNPLSPSPNENNSNPHPHTPVNINPARGQSDFPKLDCADAETWRDFLKNRKTKRLPNTPTAHAKLRKDLARWAQETGWPPGEVFTACVGRGWGAIYDPRQDESSSNDRPANRKSGGSLAGPASRALAVIEGGNN
jgi:hypothetical protein